jgi:hypothetical protein
MQIDGASIPRQRLGKRLVTLVCKSWLRIPTFPMKRIHRYAVLPTKRVPFEHGEHVVTTASS